MKYTNLKRFFTRKQIIALIISLIILIESFSPYGILLSEVHAASPIKENKPYFEIDIHPIDTSKDSTGAVPLLKTLLEGVDMTDKQLGEVFKKFGVEKFDPLNEKFDPSRHCAIFQIPDPSKPSGTVASVVKVGYMLHDRVLRPAEVGVTEGGPTTTEEAAENSEQKSSEV